MTLGLIVWGLWSLSKLPLDAVPDITNNQVQVITLTPTLAAQETERLVTFPIEQAVANIPNIEEVRSISRFGLSVVTIVFEEHVDIYFARQLIAQQLKEAEELIPAGIGSPEMAPVSTGLGEVYQYVIHPSPGSEDKYSAMDLRTMQDWIVARQLYGIPGVAEVNSFGGQLKQYEVAIHPNKLQGMNVTIAEVFQALADNNENTGGAYIDKKPNAYFIRGVGLIQSFQDIESILVKKVNNIPVLIRDVAEVRMGYAIPYGAMTYNGEKEVVGGMVMMLKGANSNEVVEQVKLRMEVIRKSLPQDIIVEPFLDRTELVSSAVSTVKTNLIEGALIVIFVLILFLGNLRAGLIVASAIPLSLLFAISMMHVFGISANLMSMGAIDFGLIVDGAVIIVEAVMHHLGLRKNKNKLTQAEMDEEVFLASSNIRNAAAFGEVIILIVYLPILALVGVEGKMFKPMAQTVCFAILGALILSLTYIPMMSALFLSKKVSHKRTFSDRMMAYFQRYYTPLLKAAIRFKYAVIAGTLALFVVAVFLFSRMGGEFIPQLQEGDYAFHCILPPGTSLSQSVETSMMASRILKSFPEVKMVIGKTGTAEVPTDPMPPEVSDMIVVLKPKSEWTTTKDYDALAAMMMEKLEVIPGVFFESSQPIQMRFNELMTGVRQDVAIKIFGENIDSLAVYAKQVATQIQNVEGITTPTVETTTGLPQVTIEYDRSKLANYGITIAEVNKTVSTAFAGGIAGVVFENERRYDLVVRLHDTYRRSIDDVKNLYIATNEGLQIPLYQVAKIEFKEGPAQISREDGKRRIVIGFNVHDRDVESVVKDVQAALDQSIVLPVGYYFTYGGTFENLKKASDRLLVAVPAALALIFFLLYMTFRSVKDGLIIFTAIPMSAIGGVFALLLRDMPFSISAGIGFIALFGVAVLNGIVLLGTFNQLEKSGMKDLMQRVYEGTKMRLRPVLMTATVASLGFLPMAISSGAGAEVQKPLATVVIGGLISATILTLFVLPILYILFHSKMKINIKKHTRAMLVLIISSSIAGYTAHAQAERKTLQEVLALSANNYAYPINQATQSQKELEAQSISWLPKTGVFVENEDFRPSDPVGVWKIGVEQDIPWPGLYRAKKKLSEAEAQLIAQNQQVIAADLRRDVSAVYYELWYLQERLEVYLQLDTLYAILDEAVRLKVITGDRPGLDSIISNVEWKEIKMEVDLIENEMNAKQIALMQLINNENRFLPLAISLEKIPMQLPNPAVAHPSLAYQKKQIDIVDQEVNVVRQEQMPDFSTRFFSQRIIGAEDPYAGFNVTVSFPLFGMRTYRNALKAAQMKSDIGQQSLAFATQQINSEIQIALVEVDKNNRSLVFYEKDGLRQSSEIIAAATLSYQVGDISFVELNQYLIHAIIIQNTYLDNLNKYNQSVIKYHYLINK